RHRAITNPNPQYERDKQYEDRPHMVVRVKNASAESQAAHGEQLVAFHTTGALYQYEPQTISSYGQWKTLWIEKLTAFEEAIGSAAKNHSNAYYSLLMDFLPYVIGLSENAIQYMQESEIEQRFHDTYQGKSLFSRY